MPHVGWRDVIDLKFDNLPESYTPQDVEALRNRVTLFLDTFEATDFGQSNLSQIKDKYGNDRLNIDLYDKTNDGWKGDSISLSVDQGWGFINQQTNEFTPMSLERMMVHEMIHAGDPRFSRGVNMVSEELSTATEEFATLETDRFVAQYMPHLGIRGAYVNAINSDQSIPQKFRDEVERAVSSVNQRMADAERALVNRQNKIDAVAGGDHSPNNNVDGFRNNGPSVP